jgi:ATP phosphoribosyltransferase regulatory subunit
MEADAEIMIILIRILKDLGLEDFRVVIGHIGFISGLFDWLELDEEKRSALKKYIIEKNFVRIEELLKECDGKKASVFMGLIQPGNDLEKITGIVSDMGEEKVSEAFGYLKGLYKILEGQDLGKYLVFDFSIIRDFDYYTGLLFEVYCRGISDMIGSGGRYDDLIKKFGRDIPATGFALDIDILHGALGDKDLSDRIKILLNCPGSCGNMNTFMELADSIRKKGIDAEILLDDIDDTLMLAREKDCSFLVDVLDDLSSFRITDTESKKTKTLDTIGLWEEIDIWIKD